MRIISLIDISSKNIITISADSLVLRLEIDGVTKETRLKPYCVEILYALFNRHPKLLTYYEITEFLKMHHLVIADDTRMHRKISELRKCLIKFHFSLNDIIVNSRGVGYGLQLKNLHDVSGDNAISFKNNKINKNISIISTLIEDAILLTTKGKIIKNSYGYVMERNAEILEKKISIFNDCEKVILNQICSHEAEFVYLRVEYLLAKLKTYIGFARISEYSISETQWLDWFKLEICALFDNLKSTIKESENY